MGSIQGNTRRMARWCEWLAAFDAAAKFAFRAIDDRLGAAWGRTGPLQYAEAQSRNEDSGGVRHIVVTLYKSRTLPTRKAVRQRGRGFARTRRRTADVGS